MRLLICLPVLILLAGCAQFFSGSAPAEPLPLLPVATALPPAPTLSPPTRLAAPTELPEPTGLPTTAALPAATDLPAATALPEPTDLPTLAALPTLPSAATTPALPTLVPTVVPTAVPTMVPTATLNPSLPLVTISAAAWSVELAVTPPQRQQGLSGREALPAGAGMLFIFESEGHRSFWMPDMHFPLDMVWINAGCEVVDVTLNAPIPLPGQSPDDLPRFSPSGPAQYVLEINAGEFEAAGISRGDSVTFDGTLSGEYGC